MTAHASKIEFGDFQSPDALVAQVINLIRSLQINPQSVVEPTCGTGSFAAGALRGFESLRNLFALEVNPAYLAISNSRLSRQTRETHVELRIGDFFDFDWTNELRRLSEPVLILGNPPWVTSAGQGAIGGRNMPAKSNFQNNTGLDAMTGKGNFDIAEWMVIRLLEASAGMQTTLAMLIKTGVARRILLHAWRTGMPVSWAHLYQFDAARHFDVAADACLFICQLGHHPGAMQADVFSLDSPSERVAHIGYRDTTLVADVNAYESSRHLRSTNGRDVNHRWRSGIKHDCSAVMELRKSRDGLYLNNLGESFALEDSFVYPMLKGSDIASGRIEGTERYMLVPQRETGEDTAAIRAVAPLTWDYLSGHREFLDRRSSSIYRHRPPFSVFGVGPYTFAPWKVAICGLYKRLDFARVGPMAGRPVVFDDTVYTLACQSAEEASLILKMLNSAAARSFFQAHIFWDAKRPITAYVLNRLALDRLASELGLADEFVGFVVRHNGETMNLFPGR